MKYWDVIYGITWYGGMWHRPFQLTAAAITECISSLILSLTTTQPHKRNFINGQEVDQHVSGLIHEMQGIFFEPVLRGDELP